MFINFVSLDGMLLMSFVINHIPYLGGLSNSFSNSFIDFYSRKVAKRKNEA